MNYRVGKKKKKFLLSATRAIKETLIFRKLMDDQTSVLNCCQYISFEVQVSSTLVTQKSACTTASATETDSIQELVLSALEDSLRQNQQFPCLQVNLNTRKAKNNYIHGLCCSQDVSGARAKCPSKLTTSLGLVSEKKPRYHTVAAAAWLCLPLQDTLGQCRVRLSRGQ